MRGSAFAAGYDLYGAKDVTIPGRGKALVDTGLSIAVGEGCCEFCFSFLPVPSAFVSEYDGRRSCSA